MQDQNTDRLYIVTRADLSIGLQAAQAVHAAFQISHEHRDLVEPWHLQSNYLVIVAVSAEPDLYDLISRARERGIVACGVREPDLDDQITAVALEPGLIAQRLCANLPLALKQVIMA